MSGLSLPQPAGGRWSAGSWVGFNGPPEREWTPTSLTQVAADSNTMPGSWESRGQVGTTERPGIVRRQNPPRPIADTPVSPARGFDRPGSDPCHHIHIAEPVATTIAPPRSRKEPPWTLPMPPWVSQRSTASSSLPDPRHLVASGLHPNSVGPTPLALTTHAIPRSALAIHSSSRIRGVEPGGASPLASTI